MIKRKTVFVLGAGASRPYGFPTGEELHDEICKRLLNPKNSFLTKDPLNFPQDKLKDFRSQLIESGLGSVDLFLEKRPDNQLFRDIGKAAMAKVVLGEEDPDKLFDEIVSRRQRWRKLGGRPDQRPKDWYQLLWREHLSTDTFDDFPQNDLQVITFNYDRSFEQYLITVLQSTYGKELSECAKMLEDKDTKFEIVHVHGSLGRLPWQSARTNSSADTNSSAEIKDQPQVPELKYQTSVGPNTIKAASQSIKIVPETDADTVEFKRARKLLLTADRICSLGFGFYRENVSKLALSNVVRQKHNLHGTALGLSRRTKNFIERLDPSGVWNPFVAKRLVELPVYDYVFKHMDLTA